MQTVNSLLNVSKTFVLRAVDLSVSSRGSWLITGGFLACLSGKLDSEDAHKRYRIPLFGVQSLKLLPVKDALSTGGLYAGLLMVIGTGGGRIPATWQLAAYTAAHGCLFVANGYVLSRIGTRPDPSDGSQLLGGAKVCIRKKALPLVAAWFGALIADGWFRARMPANTLPFVSLFKAIR